MTSFMRWFFTFAHCSVCIKVSIRVCSVFKIDDSSLHSAVQEDNHVVLSISYIAQHCFSLGNGTNLTLPSCQLKYCMCSLHAHVFTTAGLSSLLWRFWWAKTVGPLGWGCVSCAYADLLIASATQILMTGWLSVELLLSVKSCWSTKELLLSMKWQWNIVELFCQWILGCQ